MFDTDFGTDFDAMTFDEPTAYATRCADRVWVFASTGGAYNTTQVDDRIKDGDILLVPSEGVAGWLDQAWPTAATSGRGAFHHIAPGRETTDTDRMSILALEVWAEYQAGTQPDARRGTPQPPHRAGAAGAS